MKLSVCLKCGEVGNLMTQELQLQEGAIIVVGLKRNRMRLKCAVFVWLRCYQHLTTSTCT